MTLDYDPTMGETKQMDGCEWMKPGAECHVAEGYDEQCDKIHASGKIIGEDYYIDDEGEVIAKVVMELGEGEGVDDQPAKVSSWLTSCKKRVYSVPHAFLQEGVYDGW